MEHMNNATIYVVIPYFSDGVEVNQNEVKAFFDYEDASNYQNTLYTYSETTTTTLVGDSPYTIIKI